MPLQEGLKSSGRLCWVAVVSFRKCLSLFLHLSVIIRGLFCLSHAKIEACGNGKKGGGEEWFNTRDLWGHVHRKVAILIT